MPINLTSSSPNITLEPNKPTSPKNLDITLASIFKTLNLKRKAHDDLQELSSSNIIRLCSPNPLTLPESVPKPPIRLNRKSSKSPRGLKSAKKGNGSLTDDSLPANSLVEIPIQQSQDSYDVVKSLSSMIPMEKVEDIIQLNGNGLVAGPKQPPPQCFTNSSYVDPKGLAGGLALWWTVEVEISVEEANKNFMHVIVSDKVVPSLDLEFKGPKFTWRNNRGEDSFIMERIDMAFADSKWRELHEHAMVFVEIAVDAECLSVVTDVWNQQQLKIEATKEQRLVVQKQLEQGFNHELVVEERGLARCLEDLWQKEAMYWH
ncbi:hypothetical protein RHSIM_Rhsim02G0125500 [Rhododendron simsii]|uniref:Uncharacterized protein n=1 Tax=Rhododendron simsii TaxID=118357 RepID=A0A834HE99_RHOSS|nr:hypothetical protein RHSIM_Rhsim02G0125500 [Rhododendron simsii]